MFYSVDAGLQSSYGTGVVVEPPDTCSVVVRYGAHHFGVSIAMPFSVLSMSNTAGTFVLAQQAIQAGVECFMCDLLVQFFGLFRRICG